MRGAPHNGLASAIVRINGRTSGGTPGRPSRRRLFHVQKSRKPWRCQARTVSGLTITMTSRHPSQSFDSQTHSTRSALRERQSLGSRSVHHVELMAQCQDLKLQGGPSAERDAQGQEQRDNDGSHRRTLSAEGSKVNASKKNEILGRHTRRAEASRGHQETDPQAVGTGE